MSYTIEVERKISKGTGTLTYRHGAVSINTICWFELANPIPAKKYIGCSATHMLTKKTRRAKIARESIFPIIKQAEGVFLLIWELTLPGLMAVSSSKKKKYLRFGTPSIRRMAEMSPS